MTSLANCIKIHKPDKSIADQLLVAAKAYRGEGFSAHESNEGAVKDVLRESQAEREDIIGQIREQIPDYEKKAGKAFEEQTPVKKGIVTTGKLKEVAKRLSDLPAKKDAKVAVQQLFGEDSVLDDIEGRLDSNQNVTDAELKQLRVANEYMADMERAIIERDSDDIEYLLRKHREARRDPDYGKWKAPTRDVRPLPNILAKRERKSKPKFAKEPITPETKLEKSIAPTEKVNGITRETMGRRIARGDESVLDDIREGIEKHGLRKMQDAVRNQTVAEVAKAEKGKERKSIQENIAKLQGRIDNILKGVKEKPVLVAPRSTANQVKKYMSQAIGTKKAKSLIDSGKVVVVETGDELMDKVGVTESEMDAQRDLMGYVLGAYHKGTTYLVARNLNESTTYSTLLHEMFHAERSENGWKGIFGKNHEDIKAQYEKLIKLKHAGLTKAQEKARNAGTPEADLFEESLTYFIQEKANQDISLFKRILSAIRAWAIRSGFKKIVKAEDLIDLARASLRRQTGAIPVRIAETTAPIINEFAQDVGAKLSAAKKKITDNPNFLKWFKNSQVVDEDGEPLVCYHGTRADFTAFSKDFYGSGIGGEAREGFFFTSSSSEASDYAGGTAPGKRVMPVYLSIKKPLSLDYNEHGINSIIKSDEDIANYLKKIRTFRSRLSGKDGLILENIGGNKDLSLYVALEPTQIKSIYNTGTFDPKNPDIRYAMEEQVRREGVPLFARAKTTTFQDTLGPTTEADLEVNRKFQKDIKAAAYNSIKRVSAEIQEGVDKFLGSISTRLGNISPKIKAKMRRLDYDIGTLHTKDVKTVEGMLRKEKKMSKDDYADFDYARKNSAIEIIDRLVDKYNMRDEYQAYRDTLNRLSKEAYDVGLVFGKIEEYAPRILKDSRGFLTAISKNDEWPIYSRRIKEKADELRIDVDTMDADQRANIISNMILGGWSGLGGVPAIKHRKLQKIPPELNQYYMSSDAALMQHLYSMRKLIETRKFFGKIPDKVAKIRKNLYATQARIRGLNKELAASTDEKEIEKLKKRINKNIGLEKEYTAYIAAYAVQRDYKENIGTYINELIINEEIAPRHERVLSEILNARFHEKGTRGLVQVYKNLSYIDTMGSPISALTQIGDLAWAMYEGGMIKTLKHAYKSIRKRSRITKEDIGVSRIAQEFADPGTLSNAVSFVFKYVGLEKIDSIGKESLLNTALERYQKEAKENPAELKKQIGSIFEGETNNVINDLIKDKITDNVKLLVYSRLLDFQPVALSEMPQKYLDAGNGRLFYMLKTFTIKVFDVFRNEAYNKIKKGDAQGFKNLVRLACFFVLANAGADEIKDFVLGRKTDFKDRAVDNMLRLFGVSKFITWKARTEGVGSALSRQILPPFKFIDAAGKDMLHAGDEKGLEVMASIPIAGKLAYWHFFRGKHKREDLWDRRLRKKKAELNKVKNKLDTSKNKREFKHKYHTELLELKKINEFQGELNQIKKRINKLKSLTESITRKEYIQKLTLKRTNMIKLYLK